MYEPHPVPLLAVLPYRHLAAREGVSVKADAGTTWWAITTPEGLVLAFAGLWQSERLARFKGAWTRPDCRGAGYGTALVSAILEAAPTDRPLEVIHVRGGRESFWPARGLEFTGKVRSNGGRVYRRPPA